jgi:hypothetical protein
MGKYVWCHRVSAKIHHLVCERKCGKISHCKSYSLWDDQEYLKAKAIVDEEKKRLEEENGVVKIGAGGS